MLVPERQSAMNEANLVKRLHHLAIGDLFLREVDLPLHAHIRASNDYLPLVTGDAPTWVEDGISFANGETTFLDFDIPMDYAQEADILAVRCKVMPAADHSDTTDIGFTTAQDLYQAGATVDATVATAVAETAVASTGALVREVVLDISGGSYEPGDHIRRTIDVNSDGTELILVGMGLIYGGGLAAYNDDDRNLDIG